MKKLFKTFSMLLAAAAVMTATSCSDDLGKEAPQAPGLEDDENTPSVYIGVNFSMPTQGATSRSYTSGNDESSDGTEVGSDAENNVSEVLLVLAQPEEENFAYIASAVVPKKDIYKHSENVSASDAVYHAKARFTKNQLAQYYLKPGTSEDYEARSGNVSVFVIVNPSGAIVTALDDANYGDTDWTETIGEVIVEGVNTKGSIWTPNNFLMSNAHIDSRFIPKKFSDWNKYATSSHYFNLSADNETSSDDPELDNSKGGAVDVIRAAARMDFRDGSQDALHPSGVPFTYNVIYEDDSNGQPDYEKPIIDVLLNKMCLVNMSNSFYYFKRVSNTGLNTPGSNGWALCGPEKTWFAGATGNYVVSTEADMKSNFQTTYQEGTAFEFTKYFNYTFFENDGELNPNNVQAGNDRWYVSQLTDVVNGTPDQWESPNKKGEYKVWRYLTENTIPGATKNQVNGISTGVVFKGKLTVNEKATIKAANPTGTDMEKFYIEAYNALVETVSSMSAPDHKASADDPVLYSIGGDVYATWAIVRKAAIYSSVSYSLSPDGKSFVVDWNRENSLYQAVFGKGGTGFTLEYKTLSDDETEVITATYVDPLEADKEAPDYLFSVWDKQRDNEENEIAFKKAATGNDITIYQTSDDNVDGPGYYCYYYYWNRHNDNGNNGVMGQMEFAVVRNNVYKLAVTDINKLGHPRIPLNDPDSPTPNTPDEKENVYITVDAKVLPWVVRVNNIVF